MKMLEHVSFTCCVMTLLGLPRGAAHYDRELTEPFGAVTERSLRTPNGSVTSQSSDTGWGLACGGQWQAYLSSVHGHGDCRAIWGIGGRVWVHLGPGLLRWPSLVLP